MIVAPGKQIQRLSPLQMILALLQDSARPTSGFEDEQSHPFVGLRCTYAQISGTPYSADAVWCRVILAYPGGGPGNSPRCHLNTSASPRLEVAVSAASYSFGEHTEPKLNSTTTHLLAHNLLILSGCHELARYRSHVAILSQPWGSKAVQAVEMWLLRTSRYALSQDSSYLINQPESRGNIT